MLRKYFVISIILSVVICSRCYSTESCAKLIDISAGEKHTLALDELGGLWSCGGTEGLYNQLGLGNISQNVLSLQQVKGPNGVGNLGNVISFDAGWVHSLAIANGFCYAWGTDYYEGAHGILGNGPGQQDSSVPMKVHGLNNDANGLPNIVMVSAGRSGKHSLAVDSNGFVYAWGYNGSGQCGDGGTYDRQSPVLVWDSGEDPNNTHLGDEAFIVDVDAGVEHSLALTDEGYVYEWGDGLSVPQKVSGPNGVGYLSNIIDIATCEHSLAVDSNHQVWYWTTGGNPIKISGLNSIVKVAAGHGDKCAALDSGGNVWEWTGSGGSPVKVTDGDMQTQSGYLENIIALDAGYNNFRVAIDIYGRGWSWGPAASDYGGIGGVSAPEPVEMLCADVSPSVYFEKTFEIQGWLDPNCAHPFIDIAGNYLIFEISYGNPITNPSDPNYIGTISDVNIIDHLPAEVDFYSAPGGSYDGNDRTVKFSIGDISPGEQGSVTISVKVNEYARPCGQIINTCQLAGYGYWAYTDVNVPVCPWGGEIIYVDQDANGFNNGTDWQNAYLDIADAIQQAKSSCTETTTIWVANGIYQPVYDINEENYQDKSFELIEGIGLFGHFAAGEESLDERDFSNPANETVLEGKIGTAASEAVKYILKANNVEDGTVDGFTIRGSYSGAGVYGAGVYLDNSDVSIVNCKLKDNRYYGIQAANYSCPDIHNCLFIENSSKDINVSSYCWPVVSYCTFDGNDTTSQGIHMEDYTILDVEDSIFKDHTGDGIAGTNGDLTLTSCKFESNNGNGLGLSNIDATITKCSIKNSNYNGIYATNGCSLILKNSIISYSGKRGINLNDDTGTTILNNWIHHNGINHNASEGSGFYSSNHTVGTLLLRNNTIYDNYTYGIESTENGADPNIRNCIITGNDSNDLYRVNGSFNKVNYCLLQNDHSGIGNKTGDPGFMNIDIDADDLHLDGTSQCKDAGDPNGNYDETDIDGEERIINGRVDIGGDEFYISAVDFNGDGIVDFADLFVLCGVWLSEVEEMPDIVDNNFIDFADFTAFAKDWQWKASWPDKRILLATDFESGIPAGWTVVDWLNDDKTWTTNNLGGRSSEYWTGAFCIVDSDKAGHVDMNEMIITPVIDCSGAIEVTLKFSHDFQYVEGEKCDVDISINNGPWQTILQYAGADAGGNISEDISVLAADQSNVRIRWHYYDANWLWYWGIDNVEIIGNFRIPPMQMGMGDDGGSTLKSVSLGFESAMLSTGSLSLDTLATKEVTTTDSLMLSVDESLRTRPERLTAKSQKFYDITPETTISARQKQLDAMKTDVKVSIKEILQWLDEVWLSGDLKESMTEEEYLEFRKSIEESDE